MRVQAVAAIRVKAPGPVTEHRSEGSEYKCDDDIEKS